MEFKLVSGIRLEWGAANVQISPASIVLAHAGCSLLPKAIERARKREEKIPEELIKAWREAGWLRTEEVTKKLGRCLVNAAREAGLEGVVLWDTMRKGSDYWRPGKGLRLTAEIMRDERQEIRFSLAMLVGCCGYPLPS